jgi:hypothetical protein
MKRCSDNNVIGCSNGLYIANSLLTFKVKKSEFVTDENTGNFVSEESLVKITAHLEGNLSTIQNVGINPQSGLFKGNLVEPKVFPLNIDWDATAAMTYIDPETDKTYIGKFFMQPLFKGDRPAVVKAMAKRLGSEIAGTFQWV